MGRAYLRGLRGPAGSAGRRWRPARAPRRAPSTAGASTTGCSTTGSLDHAAPRPQAPRRSAPRPRAPRPPALAPAAPRPAAPRPAAPRPAAAPPSAAPRPATPRRRLLAVVARDRLAAVGVDALARAAAARRGRCRRRPSSFGFQSHARAAPRRLPAALRSPSSGTGAARVGLRGAPARARPAPGSRRGPWRRAGVRAAAASPGVPPGCPLPLSPRRWATGRERRRRHRHRRLGPATGRAGPRPRRPARGHHRGAAAGTGRAARIAIGRRQPGRQGRQPHSASYR